MFIRRKGNSFYLVENQRINGKVKQKVVQYLGVNPTDKEQYQPKLNILYQGKVQDFLTKLPDDSCDCIIADPPYFISKERVFRRSQQKDIQRNFGAWDNGNFEEFFEGWIDQCFRVLKHNFFLFTRFEKIQYFAERFPEFYKTTLVWHKTNPSPHFQKNTFISSCEAILFFQKRNGLFNFQEVNQMHNFFECPSVQGKTRRFHPTQKNEKLIEWLLKIGSKENSLVLDLFSGSGTTSRVAKRMDRNFIGVEEDGGYIGKARGRL